MFRVHPAKEKARVYLATVTMPLQEFLEQCEAQDVHGHGLPLFGSTIGGFEPPRIKFIDILTHYAHWSDPDVENPVAFFFTATKGGEVLFDINATMKSCQDALAVTVDTLVYSEDIVTKNRDLPNGEIIAWGALYFGRHSGIRLTEDCVIIDCYHLD